MQDIFLVTQRYLANRYVFLMARKRPGPPTGIHRDFALRFREACEQAPQYVGETQEELSRAFAVSTTAIFHWRNGDKLPDMDNAVYIANKLGVCVEWLLTGRGSRYPIPSMPFLEIARVFEQVPELLDIMANFTKSMENALKLNREAKAAREAIREKAKAA